MSVFHGSDMEMMVPVKGLSPTNRGILNNTKTKSPPSSTASISNNYYSSLFSDLYNTDLSIDSRGALMHEQDDIKAIIDLYYVDVEVDKSQNCVVRDIFYELHSTDVTIDGNAVPSVEDIKFFDPFLSSQMRHYCAVDQARYDEARAEVMNLLATDMEMDQYSHLNIDMELLHDLISVDKEMDSAKDTDEGKLAFAAVKDLYAVDQKIDSHTGKRISSKVSSEPLEYSVPLKGLSPPEQDAPGKTAGKVQIKKPYSSLMGDLYATDLSVDSRGAYVHEKDDIAAVLDLYSVDQAVDMKKTSATGGIMHEIRKIDIAVERIQEEKVEFIDPLLSNQMRQYQASRADEANRDGERADVMDLWKSDTEVDERKYQSMDESLINDLVSIDKEIDSAKYADEAKTDFDAVRSLYTVDKQVQRFEPMENTIEQLGPPPPPNQKRSIFSPQEKAAAQKRSIFSEYEKAQSARRQVALSHKY
jgi:hypothetical protein